MPSAPPAAVTSISEFSTVAGASCARIRGRGRAPRSRRRRRRSRPRERPRSCSIWSRGSPFADVDGLAAEATRLREALVVQVADDHDGGAEQLRAGRGGEPHGPGPGDVDRGADAHAGRDGAVEAGGEDVGEHRQVQDLLQRLVAVGELQQVPVRVRHQHVLGLAADPAAHVDVAVGAAGAVGVDVQADAGLALLAVAAAAAGDVEGHGDDVADLDEFDVGPDLDDLAGDLVPEHQVRRARWCVRAPCAGRSRRCWWRRSQDRPRAGPSGPRSPG